MQGAAPSRDGEVERVRASLVTACDSQELRTALLEAMHFRSNPTVAAEMAEARERLRVLKKTETQALQDPELCVICMEGQRTHAFLPCGHRAVCNVCRGILRTNECPICREQFSSAVSYTHLPSPRDS